MSANDLADYSRYSQHFAYLVDKGKSKAILEGKIEMAREITRNLLKMDIPIATISKACGLSEEEIKSL